VSFSLSSVVRLVTALVLAAGPACTDLGLLPDPQPVDGRLLYQSGQVEGPSFVREGTHVVFNVRRRRPEGPQSGAVDWAIVPFDGSAPARFFLRNRSDRFDPVVVGEPFPEQYWVVRDERTVATGSRGERTAQVGTLSRVSFDGGVLEDVPDVLSFSYDRGNSRIPEDDRLLFQRPQAGTELPAYHLRDRAGRERLLTDVTGGLSLAGGRSFFYIGGPSRTLYFVPDLDAPAEPVRAGVARYLSRGDLAIMQVPEAGAPINVVFDFARRSERKLPGERICCWMGFEGDDEFLYAESRAGDVPARLHRYNLRTGADTVLDMPPEMVDVSTFVDHPDRRFRLYQDSKRRYVLYKPDVTPALRLLDISPVERRFTLGGRFFLYLDPQPPGALEGNLMIVDGDFLSAPRKISPDGTIIEIANNFTIDGTPPLVVFWGRFGPGASDLFFADLDSGQTTLVASRIRDVSVTRDRIFGIIRTSQQDLVGDLVERDLTTGNEIVFARSVDGFTAFRNQIVFVLRTRQSTEVEGLRALETTPE
jgi:hypothetical protein